MVANPKGLGAEKDCAGKGQDTETYCLTASRNVTLTLSPVSADRIEPVANQKRILGSQGRRVRLKIYCEL
jgi:hypothetical protein